MINPTLSRVTQRITHRSQASRAAYLARIEAARSQTVHRAQLACGNLPTASPPVSPMTRRR